MLIKDFSLYDANLPLVTSSKIFTNKNEFHEDGLYSQKIFGPIKNYECKCGNLKGKYYKGQRCSVCGVLCDTSDLRMKTFAHIQLPQDVWVMLPPLRSILHKLFGKKNLEKILNFDPHVFEEHNFFVYDMNNLTLVNIDNIIAESKMKKLIAEVENIDDINSIDIEQYMQLRLKYTDLYFERYVDEDKYLKQFKVYSIINLKQLFDFLYNETDVFKRLEIDKNIAKYCFINKIPVTPPDTRPVIPIAQGRYSVDDITKSYSEILKNLEHKFMDNIYAQIQDEQEKNLFLANAAKKFQRSVDALYQFIQDKKFGEKTSVFRSSVLGKTIEFSGRAVVTCGPNVPPYMLSVPRDAAKTLFILEVLNWLVNNENDVLDIHDIASLMQLIVNSVEDAELNISDELFDEIFEKIRPHLRLMFERPPTLFMYNDSTFILDKLFEHKFKIKEDT